MGLGTAIIGLAVGGAIIIVASGIVYCAVTGGVGVVHASFFKGLLVLTWEYGKSKV